MKWVKDGLSFDETKVSAIIIAFFITLVVSLYQALSAGDISNNLLMLLAYELGAFTGIKVAETITDYKREGEDDDQDVPRLP
ncbi:hypothetical protein BSK59_16325 [Paenibacillus odorifer]|uniref:hypothetical protein n=1 Tax=Paenibacillus odorifer TaxID=189426 RepID=UPI00096F1936|nr:hypothetical protein [Paenibacillus odorifer]OME54144.1 hypothetical protein BSK59_16325 [Paenibacillus odorifer]